AAWATRERPRTRGSAPPLNRGREDALRTDHSHVAHRFAKNLLIDASRHDEGEILAPGTFTDAVETGGGHFEPVVAAGRANAGCAWIAFTSAPATGLRACARGWLAWHPPE